MGYYDDYYEEPYDGYEERIEPVNLALHGEQKYLMRSLPSFIF